MESLNQMKRDRLKLLREVEGLLSLISQPILVVDSAGTVIHTNSFSEKIWGCSQITIMNKLFHELIESAPLYEHVRLGKPLSDKEIMLKIKATVTVTDTEFIVDYTGSHDAVKGPVNIPLGLTEGVSALAFKALTTPDTPANDGNFRMLRVIAPPGTLVNAQQPVATFTIWPALHMPEIICKALAPAMPELVPACSGGDLASFMGVGIHPVSGKVWLESSNEAVGFGGHAGHAGGDGEDGIMHLSEPGCRNNPIEVLEHKAPLLVEGYFLRQDSGGPGEHRGGVWCKPCLPFIGSNQCRHHREKDQDASLGLEWWSGGRNKSDHSKTRN